ncbi:unnamed protein product [Polarella glacialis]|uniref:Uncharacterized protein n=1 Tax=Polarella glacialis TaxID=89957 RepID=A0A813KI35_POLGL|nr:unnamed protein product [Polarella glacialis]CAE8700576.1 unnamed protein product [Polarella glacialis]
MSTQESTDDFSGSWISTAASMLGMGRLLQCCNSSQHDASACGELKVVQLSSDMLDGRLVQPVHLLTHQDSFSMTISPRAGAMGELPRILGLTPRQQSIRDRIHLPRLLRYPLPPGSLPEESEDKRRDMLLQVYQDFVLDLHKGLHMTQLSSDQEYSDIHCQILEDLVTLKVDQGSGCIIEFPLTAVSKVYRIVKNDDRWYSAGSLTGPTPMPPLPLSNAEHIVVVEFMRRKLAFVFADMVAAQRFLMCIELLIRRAQEQKNDSSAGLLRGGKGDSFSPMFSSGSRGKQPGERFGRSLLGSPSPGQEVDAETSSGGQNCGVCQLPA